MSLDPHDGDLNYEGDYRLQRRSIVINGARRKVLFVFLAFSIVLELSGCVSVKINDQTARAPYQKLPAVQSTRRRVDIGIQDKGQPLKRLQTSYYSSPPPSQPISGVTVVTDPSTGHKTVLASGDTQPGSQPTILAVAKCKILSVLSVFQSMVEMYGGVSDQIGERSDLVPYQEHLANQGPQQRADTDGRDLEQPLALLKPAPSKTQEVSGVATVKDPNTGSKTTLASGMIDSELAHSPTDALPDLQFVMDPNTGLQTVELTIEEALTRALANSPEITVVSFDPSIARQDITRAASEFDFTAFGRVNYEKEDSPPNSIFQPGQSDVRTYETGIKQKGITGAEWSVSYGLTRAWDDLVGRPFPLRYEPLVTFQLKQPLLRDAWQDVTLAGIDIAKLNYKIALLGFREKSEDIAAQVVSAYWGLVQVRRDAEIQQELLNRTLETLNKVEGRKGIDATNVQIKQTESFIKIREATLLHAKKAVLDTQETLIRLMADAQLNVLDEFEIIPVSEITLDVQELEPSEVLKIAMRKNPKIRQARAGIEIADINVRVAENQKMPRLDLIASARTQGLDEDVGTSHDRLKSGDYASYAVGLSLEYPLGNRQREAELLRRRLERRQAVAKLHNVADQVAIAAKEGVRRIRIDYSETQIQKEAVGAARIHLQTLKDTEPVREQLTPEFLLVTLQAQEILANAQRAEIQAVVDFNVSQVQLAQILGTVLELHQIKSSLPAIPGPSDTIK